MVEMRFKVAVCLNAVYFIEGTQGRRKCLGWKGSNCGPPVGLKPTINPRIG